MDYDSYNGDAASHNGTANGGAASPLPPQTSASSIIRKKLMGYVGFANLPNQVHRKSVRKGFQFTAMVVGTSLRARRPAPFDAYPPQASRASASPRSSTRSLTRRCTRPRSRSRRTQSARRRWPSRA